jgi:hypothetical protein
MMHDHR